jgi:hypothetical protein
MTSASQGMRVAFFFYPEASFRVSSEGLTRLVKIAHTAMRSRVLACPPGDF